MSTLVRVGIDENGLGPRLGPLIVTAAVARVTPEGKTLSERRPRGALAKRLGDSKALVSHADIALGEAWARAVASRMGVTFADPDALLAGIAFEDRRELRGLCPSHVEPQCWSSTSDAFTAEDKLLRTVQKDLDKLRERGVDVTEVRTSITCTKRINQAKEEGRSRLLVDLHAMERMLLSIREREGVAIDAVCGKVGGYAKYSPAFGPLGGRLHAIAEEGAARSAYSFPGLGHVAFVRDADANDLLVALASMVGKWVRELLMARIVDFYGTSKSGEPYDASGYYDPVTTAFIDATALTRKRRRIPDTCFERTPDAATAGL